MWHCRLFSNWNLDKDLSIFVFRHLRDIPTATFLFLLQFIYSSFSLYSFFLFLFHIFLFNIPFLGRYLFISCVLEFVFFFFSHFFFQQLSLPTLIFHTCPTFTLPYLFLLFFYTKIFYLNNVHSLTVFHSVITKKFF